MDEIIVYNTPFECMNECVGCYLKRTVNLANVDISKGVTNLCKRLSGSWEGRSGIETQSKKATLMISVTNNKLSWSHVKFILKKTRHLRKFRETHLQVNMHGLNLSVLMEAIEEDAIDEISLSCDGTNYEKAAKTASTLKKEYGVKNVSCIFTFDIPDAVNLETIIDTLSRTFDTVYIGPIVDAAEVKTMERTAIMLPIIQTLIGRYTNLTISGCTANFGTRNCPVSPETYAEITGNITIKGCPYKLYKECKYGDKPAKPIV